MTIPSADPTSTAEQVWGFINELLTPKSVVGIGKTAGNWLDVIARTGVEITRSTYAVEPPAATLTQPDVSAELMIDRVASKNGLEKRFDLALSIEDAGFLKQELSESYIEFLTSLSDVIFFTSPIPFQGDALAINEQWPQYWSILFRARGYECVDIIRDQFWNNCSVDWRIAQNGLIFVKFNSQLKTSLPAQSGDSISRVHPLNHLKQILFGYRPFREYAANEEITDYLALLNSDFEKKCELPRLEAIERAKNNAGRKDVFPYSRLEISWPERELKSLEEESVSLNFLRQRETGIHRDTPLTIRVRRHDDVYSSVNPSSASRELTLLREIEYLHSENKTLKSAMANKAGNQHSKNRPNVVRRLFKKIKNKFSRSTTLAGQHYSDPPHTTPFRKITEAIDDIQGVLDHEISKEGSKNNDQSQALNEWNKFVENEGSAYLKEMRPHHGRMDSALRFFILVGGGGLGDILMATPILRRLRENFPNVELTVGYEPSIVKEALSRNPDVKHIVNLKWGDMHSALCNSIRLDFFDAVVYVRCFIPYMILCNNSRVDDFAKIAFFDFNKMAAGKLLSFNTNIGLSVLNAATGIHYLELMGSVTNLGISKSTPPIYHPKPEDAAIVGEVGLRGVDYVTIREGANPGDLALANIRGVGRTTKQLPESQWRALIKGVKAMGLTVVQLGTLSETALEGVDVDLRGRSTLSQSFHLISGARCHIDTEGGLIHLASCSTTQTIAMFGPTSASFFGYEANVNVKGDECAPCWYAHDAWLFACMRDGSNQPCYASLSMEKILDAIGRIKPKVM